jgi:hypothetical protein
MYQVGFGDCFLLTFTYAAPLPDGRNVRHVLIDFGSTRLPWRKDDLTGAARSIHAKTGGELDVIVVSHRHKDHLSGFGPKETAELALKTGYPRLVVRSWTEHPTIARDAKAPAAAARANAASIAKAEPRSTDVRRTSVNFARSLLNAEKFAVGLTNRLGAAKTNSLPGELKQLADDQVANKPAVDQLQRWADAGTGAYLNYGVPSQLEAFVPGITVRVMGPPTVNQYPAVAKQRSKDSNEFWQIYNDVLKNLTARDLILRDPDPEGGSVPPEAVAMAAPDWADAGPPPPTMAMSATDDDPVVSASPSTTTGEPDPGPVRWLTDKLGRQRVNSLLRIVRVLDDVMNNTSVILLIDVPSKKDPLRLLFGGDAQIENWEWALKKAPDHEANLDLLRNVDVYKVGHHGSRNATPRTLFNLWKEDGIRDRPMVALMSTKYGVHGKTPATQVPRKTLVAAIDTRVTNANFFKTTNLKVNNTWCVELVYDLTTDKSFTVNVPQPTA